MELTMQQQTTIKGIYFGIGITFIAITAITLVNYSERIFYPNAHQPDVAPTASYARDGIEAAVLRSVEFQDGLTATSTVRSLIVGTPTLLLIPRIHVNATLESVGLTARGAVDTPKGPASPAWYSLGPRPGAVGNAVIVGHYGWKNNIPAVFDHLAQINIGDRITVLDANGNELVFVVRKLHTYGARDTATEVFLSDDGKAHLNLITCSGVWNKKNKSYSTRLVVFADKE